MNTNPWGWLTIPVFLEFAADKGVDLSCRRCPSGKSAIQQTLFNVGNDPDGFIPWLPLYTLTENGLVAVNKSRHLPVVRLTCGNCGHVEHFSMYVVEAWHKGKYPEKIPGDAENE